MSRLINLFLLAVVLAGAFWLYQVKHEAKQEEERIAHLEHQITEEKAGSPVAQGRVELSQRPSRVQRLSDRFSAQLGLKEVAPYQIGDVADLPDRTPAAPALAGDHSGTAQPPFKPTQPASVNLE